MPAVRGAILAACEIRLRAERKAGQLCAALERSNPGKRKTDLAGPVPPKCDRLRNAGISEDQARRWEKLAAVPAEIFARRCALLIGERARQLQYVLDRVAAVSRMT
jgi:hypothetical protein